MTIRSGMTTLITRLRGMTNAGTADATVAGETYWSDEHLQDVLDAHRMDHNRTQLSPEPEWVNGTLLYHDYYAPAGNFEEAASGTQYWRVEDGEGYVAGTATYSVDYARGVVRFAADTNGTAYYLRGRSYNLNGAAAAVWERKAGFYAAMYDVSTDNHRLNRSQLIKHCLAMAAEYEARGGIHSSRVVRADLT